MSLDTVIKIGKFYRETKDAWQYHDQINWVMKDVNALAKKKDKEGNLIETLFYEVNVTDTGADFVFDLDGMTRILDEDKMNAIYYLNFKTSKKDSSKRYLLGDVVYSCYQDKKNKWIEGGNYRLGGNPGNNGNADKRSSFWLSEEAASGMENLFIQKFRAEFRRKVEVIERFLRNQPSVVLHFNFDGKSWHSMDGIVDSIDAILTNTLVKCYGKGDQVTLNKYLYKTLGTSENGISTPGFGPTEYKTRLFTRDEVISLMYAGKATETPMLRVGGIGIIALPHSDGLSSEMVVDFFERKENSLEAETRKEEEIHILMEEKEMDPDFEPLLKNKFEDTVKFDIVFMSIPSSPAGTYADLIEFADVRKSLLRKVHEQIKRVRNKIEQEVNTEFPDLKKKPAFHIRTSFQNILGDVTKDNKKFQSHFLKVLPRIYTDTYYEDPLLLSKFLEKVEYNIRNEGRGFGLLKYDFYFLMNIQKKNILMEIEESKSYALGKRLGIMARVFAAWKKDCPIKSFEKSYVGNLSRRTGTLDDLVKFAAFMNEKLVMHEKAFKEVQQAYLDFVEGIKNFGNEKYNKYNCSLGFFESYYENIRQEKEEEVINN